MSSTKSGNRTHDDAVVKAEAARQVSTTPATPQATVIVADTTFHRTAALSAIANGISPSVFMVALRGLGQTLYS